MELETYFVSLDKKPGMSLSSLGILGSDSGVLPDSGSVSKPKKLK